MARQAQLVDFDGKFCDDGGSSESVLDVLQVSPQKSDAGFGYNVISVLGCQSSGKSTLLNALFGTEFPTMNARQGVSQTTKGLWLSTDTKCAEDRMTLVIDVEGTDSKERGETRLSFEHRASLFSLALSDMVIVNMWFTDIGRYTASNYELLRTVLRVNLELFGSSRVVSKTRLVFVIRDFNPIQTALEVVEARILVDLETLWKEVLEQSNSENCPPTKYFDFSVRGVPSKLLDECGFDLAVADLRTDWMKWRPRDYSKAVPYDGFFQFTKSIWSAIQDSQELDIPGQRALLATYKCEELFETAVEAVAIRLPQVLSSFLPVPFDGLHCPVLPDIIASLEELVYELVKPFDLAAWRYDVMIFEQFRARLLEQGIGRAIQAALVTELEPMRQAFVAEILETTKKVVLSRISEVTRGGFPRRDALFRISEEMAEAFAQCHRGCNQLVRRVTLALPAVGDSLGMDHNAVRKTQNWIHRTSFTLSEEEWTAKTEATLPQAFESIYESAVRQFIEASSVASIDLWQQHGIVSALISASDPVELSSLMTLYSLEVGNVVRERVDLSPITLQVYCPARLKTIEWTPEGIVALAWRQFMAGLVEATDRLQQVIHSRFLRRFEIDENEVPRSFEVLSREELQQLYTTSRYYALDLLTILQEERESALLPVSGGGLSLVGFGMGVDDLKWSAAFVSPGISSRVLTAVDPQLKAALASAQRAQAARDGNGWPSWQYWLILLFFGANEIYTVVFSPYMLAMILLVASSIIWVVASGNTMRAHGYMSQLSDQLYDMYDSLAEGVQEGGAYLQDKKHD